MAKFNKGSKDQFTPEITRLMFFNGEQIGGDDINSIKHVLERRLKNRDVPDVLLIDGGKNQLNVALKTFGNVRGTKFLSISKGMKRVRQEKRIVRAIAVEDIHPMKKILMGQFLIISGAWALSGLVQLGSIV